MRGDKVFESQFQWEVDRWVFRFRHGGEPIEVSKDERDRLIERHRARMTYGSRLFGLGIVCAFILSFAVPRYAFVLPILLWVGMMLGLPALNHWANNDVTTYLKKRTPIGLRLGLSGRVARNARALRWRDLFAAIAYLAIVIGLTSATLPTTEVSGIAFLLPEGAIGILMLWLVLVKWAQHEEVRLHDEKMDAIRRARELR